MMSDSLSDLRMGFSVGRTVAWLPASLPRRESGHAGRRSRRVVLDTGRVPHQHPATARAAPV